jgi:transglutaminase-like putative cysteine protease
MSGVENILRQLARRAREAQTNGRIVQKALQVTGAEPTVRRKVEAIVEWIRVQGISTDVQRETLSLKPPYDADDAVLVAASMCVVLGIPCRVVGARVSEHVWTCWLSFLEDSRWYTVNVIDGRFVDVRQERVEVEVNEGRAFPSYGGQR